MWVQVLAAVGGVLSIPLVIGGVLAAVRGD